MSYSPPSHDQLHYDFTEPLLILSFDFISSGYSPPAAAALHFNFALVLFPLDFEFAPVAVVPISKQLLRSLAVRLRGQVYKYWTCRVRFQKQEIYRYVVSPDPKTPAQLALRSKFASGVNAWLNLSFSDKLHWRRVGVRKKEPITSINAFISAWMKDKI